MANEKKILELVRDKNKALILIQGISVAIIDLEGIIDLFSDEPESFMYKEAIQRKEALIELYNALY